MFYLVINYGYVFAYYEYRRKYRRMRIIVLVFIFFGLGFYAQANKYDHLVDKGAEFYRSKHYTKALEALNKAIENESHLHEKSIPKAYYYRGVTYIASAKKVNIDIQHVYLKAAQDLIKSNTKDKSEREWQGVSMEKLKEIEGKLSQKGLELYQQSVDGSSLVNISTLLEYFHALTFISPDSYVYFDYLGNSFLLDRDTVEALNNFEKAQEIAIESEEIDFNIAHCFYHSAVIYGLKKHNSKKGLSILEKAEKYIKNEYADLNKKGLASAKNQKMMREYVEADDLLNKLEVELYASNHRLSKKGENIFRNHLNTHPDDIQIKLYYALALIDNNKNMLALEELHQLIKLDDKLFDAYYQVAHIHITEGTRYKQLAQSSQENEEIIAYNKKGDEHYKMSLPFLEKAYDLSGKDKTIFDTILSLVKAIEDQERIQKYTNQ